jgi:ATP-dependent protease HslVU (ClpYQ) peptidase subunit
MRIAAGLCIYTNDRVVLETLIPDAEPHA